MGKITVYLDKITNLKDDDWLGKSDPYVIFRLEKDNFGPFDKNYGKQRSTKKQDDLNPTYHETFIWDNVKSLRNLVLWVQVWDDDPIFDDKLGKCKIDLNELGLSSTPTGTDRKIDNKIFRKDSRIFLQITWEQ